MKTQTIPAPAAATAASLLLLAVVLSLTGCASAPPPAAPQVRITAKVPVITAMAETSEAQERGGVEIAVVPITHRAVKRERATLERYNPSFGDAMAVSFATGGNARNTVLVEETVTPYLDVEPGRLVFEVRVNNKLSRVFRGQGTVVQFNVAGKLVPFGDTDYQEMVNGIVPPLNEARFTIRGPHLDSLPDKCTIGIFLYDVVTQTDVAGNVTERQNYTWYFDYTARHVDEMATVSVTRRTMDPAAYQERMMRQEREARAGARYDR